MPPFPDNLPPEGLDVVYKLLIYFGILYVLTTAITTWLVTRRRSSPKTRQVASGDQNEPASTGQPTMSISQAMSFDDTQDQLSSLKIEVQGAEAALAKLQELQANQQLSQDAYQQLSTQYNEQVSKLSAQMNQMLQSDIQTHTGEVDTGISDDEMMEIEADLEEQLMALEEDDSFLKSRPKRAMKTIFEEKPEEERSTQSSPTPPVTPVQKPATATPPKKVPMPPPPKKTTAMPPAPKSQAMPSKPDQPSSQKKSSMIPPPPKKISGPPSPSQQGATPPRATPAKPTSNQPLSAAQPMKVQTEDDDGMFAKSTSIAALRMDMLRELARLKKLIPEDQDKDQ